MAEVITSPRGYMNQFKNRNVAPTVSISTTSPNISPDVMNMLSQVTSSISQISQSLNIQNNKIENIGITTSQVTSSISQISQSLNTQSIQLTDLTNTANLVRINKIFSNKEIPVGEIDGVNTTYTLANEPVLGSEHLYLNGILIEEGSNTDYSISGSYITFDEPLFAGSKLSCTYYYNDTTPVKIFVDKEIPSGSIDGVNTIFELSYLPVLGSEHLYLNGVLQESGVGNDYTISDSTITFFEAPQSGLKVRCTYYYMM